MWRRHSKDQIDLTDEGAEPEAGAQEPQAADDDFTPFEQWEGHWASAEEERVARWLVDKVGPRSQPVIEHQVEHLSLAFQPERRPAGSTYVLEDRWVSGAAAGATSADRDALAGEVAALREQHEELAAGLATRHMEVTAQHQELQRELDRARAAAAEEHRSLAAGLDEARAAAAEERGRLAEALQADQEEADRVGRLQHEARVRLETELAGLEQRRHRALEELAGVEERLRAAQEQGAREEAARFEMWSAIEDEIAALERRRDRLRSEGS